MNTDWCLIPLTKRMKVLNESQLSTHHRQWLSGIPSPRPDEWLYVKHKINHRETTKRKILFALLDDQLVPPLQL